MLLLCSYFNMEQLKTHLDGIIFRCTLLMLWSNMTTPISTITLSVLKLIITTNLFHIIQLTIITVNIRERHNIVWIKWSFFFFLNPTIHPCPSGTCDYMEESSAKRTMCFSSSCCTSWSPSPNWRPVWCRASPVSSSPCWSKIDFKIMQ